ncbi:response regulator of the LytR/AlgR family [Ruminococcus sp. CAG:403]|nr:LytTR family DNA-binding domain-containing protein [Ruminococcus sp.]CDE33193.1 response regulator of the LytR/AlgR family [Ruminococcus sp. CAG:403]
MRIAIVEDQIPESEKLKTALEQLHSEWKISFEIVCYPSGEAFLLDFEKGAFDLIFLDIYMNGMTGIETARQLRKQDNHCMLVFLTTSTEHMPDAFSCHAFEYIQKPFQLDRVRTVLKDVIQCLPQQQKYLEFISNRQTVRLLYSDFMFAMMCDHYIDLISANGTTFRTRMKFSDFSEPLLQEKRFLQINKGILVNMDYIAAFDAHGCRLTNGTILPVKVRDRAQIEESWMQYSFSSIRNDQKGRKSL